MFQREETMEIFMRLIIFRKIPMPGDSLSGVAGLYRNNNIIYRSKSEYASEGAW